MSYNIALSSSMRSNLLSLRNVATQMNRTQNILSTGMRINSAIDNATSYYQARSLTNRANDLNNLLDSMSQGIQTIQAALTGLEKANTYLEQALAISKQVLNVEATEIQNIITIPSKEPYLYEVEYLQSTGTQWIDTGYVPNSNTEINARVAFMESGQDMQNFGCITRTDSNKIFNRWHFGMQKNSLTIYRSEGVSMTIGDITKPFDTDFHDYYLSDTQAGIDDTIQTFSKTGDVDVSFAIFARNGYTELNGEANIVNQCKSKLESMTIKENGILIHDYIPVIDRNGVACLYDKVTEQLLYNHGSGEFITGEIVSENKDTIMIETVRELRGEGREYQNQLNKLIVEFDKLIYDSSYQGTNLLTGGELKVIFNENHTHNLSISGHDIRSQNLGITKADWSTNKDVIETTNQIQDAIEKLRNIQVKMGNNLRIIQTRQDFTDALSDILTVGSDKLILADINKVSAEYLILQTHQQLAVNSLSLASQSAQNILSVF